MSLVHKDLYHQDSSYFDKGLSVRNQDVKARRGTFTERVWTSPRKSRMRSTIERLNSMTEKSF